MASPATPDAQTLASALAEVKLVYSPTFIGFLMATATYGIGLLQCYLYFKNYPKDTIALKITVLAMLMVDTAATALMAFTVYDNGITHFGDLAYVAIINPGKISARHYFHSLLNGASHPDLSGVSLTENNFRSLFAWQVWGISRNAIVTGTIHWVSIASGMIEGTSSLCDILITTTLIYVIRSKRMTGISTTDRMIDTIVRYIIARGVLTAITQILYLAVGLAFPGQLYWQPLRQILGKSSLNVRQSVRGKGQPETSGDLVLSNLPAGSSALNKSTVLFVTPNSVSISDIRHRDEDTLGAAHPYPPTEVR
ncbi:hypothetical protein DFH08DRAFT_945593 [Mycena albidolilacea]|uniref:DUF6534 domain-containing protein n=1 Tax=Mycena albidolilacea TaxID=1033008 RepID=A0AAD7E961_9AGAR|nr:hypothetical protein DFH08DRAFT_945593 [Mycena albidolilacea]